MARKLCSILSLDGHRQQAHPETIVVALRARILDEPVEAQEIR